MNGNYYKLNEDDYQRLWPLAPIKEICDTFKHHAQSETQIYRKMEALGLPPVMRSRARLIKEVLRSCPKNILLDDYQSEILEQMHLIKLREYIKLWERIDQFNTRFS